MNLRRLFSLSLALLPLAIADAQIIDPTVGVEVIGTTPVEGSGVDPNQIPAASYAFGPDAVEPEVAGSLPDALLQRTPSVHINDVTGNPFQPDVQYRGFGASPVLGTPQGLAVYQNGVRTNESFGDTVNWDLIPEFAIDGVEIVSNNPAFGLNALGGALAVKMKNGFTFRDSDVELYSGAFGRASATVESGIARDNFAFYIGADALRDDGWRDRSPSDLRRLYFDIGMTAGASEFHFAFTGASNEFGAVGPTPIQLLEQRWETVFTTPQTTHNQLALLTGSFSTRLTDATSLEGTAYYRCFRQSHIDGNIFDDEPPVELPDGVLPGEVDHTRTEADTFGAAIQLTSTAPVWGRDNHFAVGVSFDRGRVEFAATPEFGIIGPDLFVTGTGIILGGEDDDLGPADVRTTNAYGGFYLTDTFSLTRQLSITAGARYDIARIDLRDLIGTQLNGDETFGHFNPLLGATWQFSPAFTVYAGFSEANRAPTPAELGCGDPEHPCVLDNFLVADPPLQQVVSRTFEAGVRGRFEPPVKGALLSWNLGFFRTENTDDILNVASPTPGRGYFVNAGDTQRQGIEAQVKYQDARWTAYANYSYLDATFQSHLAISAPANPVADEDGIVQVQPGNTIPGAPQYTFKAGAEFALTTKWKLGADLAAFSSQYLEGDVSNQNPKIPAYYVVNLHSSYEITRNFEVFARIQNLLDRRYYTAGTFFETDSIPSLNFSDPRTVTPAQPFAAYAGIRINW